MITRSTLHSHSRFSDGADSMEDLVRAAMGKGFASLGFSEHAWAEYDSACCIRKEDIPAYFREFRRLKEAYAGRIELYLGFESDFYCPAPKDGLDFVIGSVHYLRDDGGAYHAIDDMPGLFERALQRVADGDVRLLVRTYYDAVAEMAESYRPDIIGHLDLVAKFNNGNRYFDELSDWYLRDVSAALERIAATGCIVEVNTGAVFRNYRKVPYPSAEVLIRMRELGIPVILGADAHTAPALDFWFEEAEEMLRHAGYRSAKQLVGGRFVDLEL